MSKLKTIILTTSLLLGAGAPAATVYTEDFSGPTKKNSTLENLGNDGVDAGYQMGADGWVYYNTRTGLDEAATGLGDGSSSANKVDSTDKLVPFDFYNGRASGASFILGATNFTDGVTYTLSFDVVGDAGSKAGAHAVFYIAELSGYDNTGSNWIAIDTTETGFGSFNPFQMNGTATVNYLTTGEAAGEAIAFTNTYTVTREFTYSAGKDMGFGFYAGDTLVGIDNVSISDNSEPAVSGPLPPPEIFAGLTPVFDPLPNIVLFLADDMGIGDTSAYQDLTENPDHLQIYTPNMERLAECGTRFTDAHSPGSTCTPSRIGLLTGSYPFRSVLKMRAGTQDHVTGIFFPGRRHTMAHMLKRAGYRTYGYGKWHIGHQSDKYGSGLMTEGPLECGFDTYTGTDGNFGVPGAMIKDRQFMRFDAGGNLVPYHDPSALPWVEKDDNDPNLLNVQPAEFAALEEDLASHLGAHATKPLFIYYASHSNHKPYVAADEIAGQLNGTNVTVAGGMFDGDNNNLTQRGRMIRENDIIVGELLDFLLETDDPRNPGHKLMDNTLFIFTSDNGSDVGNANAVGKLPQDDGSGAVQLRGKKGSVWEGGTRVPLMASMPGILATNATSSALFGLNDLYATIAEMIGHRLEPDEAVDSESLLSAWTNGLDGIVRTNDLIYQHWNILLTRRGDLKLHAGDGDYTGVNNRFGNGNNLDFDDMVFDQFYNLSNDLGEAVNLGETATATDMLAVLNTSGIQGFTRTGAEAPVNGVNFTGGDFFNAINWHSYVNLYDARVPESPIPGFVCADATVTTNLTGMRLMLRYGTFEFLPAGTGTLVNTVMEVGGGTFNASNGPVELTDSQLHIAAGLADFGSGVLGMNSSTGTVISLGGTLSAGALSIGDAASASAGAKTVRFERGDGALLLSDNNPIRFGDDGDTSDDFINFTTGTKGRLVSVEDAAFYAGLWTNGLLRIDGQTGSVSFAESGFLLLNQGDGTHALMLDSGQSVDFDGDGMDDIWEQERMGGVHQLDASGDYDLDGLTDVMEYIFNSDPQLSNGLSRVTGAYDSESSGYTVSFDSAGSRTYVVEHKSDLLSVAEWQVMDVLNGNGGNAELAYPVESSNGFYRVRVYAP